MKTRLLGVIGSLNQTSLSRYAIQYVLDHAANLGAEVRILDLLKTPLPLFDPGDRHHSAYSQVLDDVNWAHGYLLGSPDYHGGMSGTMKNFLDYFWKEFAGKLFGYVCASHEKGLTVMDQMRTTVRQCYGWSLPYGVSVTHDDFDSRSGKLINHKIGQRLNGMAYDLTTYGSLLRKQFESDITNAHPNAGFASHYQPKK